MSVQRATTKHLAAARSLLRSGRRAYIDFGDEDLPGLLARGPAVVGVTNGEVWGVACVQIEDRPVTLPADASTRAHLRCLALKPQHPTVHGVVELMEALVATLPPYADEPLLLLSYGVNDWLCKGLSRSGFDLLDTVQFYEIERLRARLEQRPPAPDFLRLAPADPACVDKLAALDAASFPPLWHFGARDLIELCLRCRVQVAYLNPVQLDTGHPDNPSALHPSAFSLHPSEEPVGYAAVAYNSRDEGQLARLAVAPALQGRGIGRELVWDAIADAVEAGLKRLVLNTQKDNTRAQRLYEGMGFRRMGESLPVLGRVISDFKSTAR